jgi:DNA (cytosine-5)-methyltransferase 1
MQLSFLEEPVFKNDFKEVSTRIAEIDNIKVDKFGEILQEWSRETVSRKINTLALFSGAGGLDIGFCDVGFNLVESVEIEEKFAKTMRLNQQKNGYFKNANIICKDIRDYTPYPDMDIDFVIGGPPCQSFSAAGRRAAGVRGTKDARGSLFEEYVRILDVLKPSGFLFENVYGLLGAEKGTAIKKISSAFEELGYKLSYRILDAADYGVPQHRERVIIVGSKNFQFKFPKPTHGPDSQNTSHLTASEALIDITLKNKSYKKVNGRFGHLLDQIPPGLNYSYFTEKMGHPNPIFAWRSKFSDFLYKADPNTPIRTLKASGGQYTGPFHWNNRPFIIEELKRLQTFPDSYEIIGNNSEIIKQIGNSVPPQFSRILALSVLEQFFKIKLPFDIHYLTENEALTFRKLKMQKTKAYLLAASESISNIIASDTTSIPIENECYKADLRDDLKLILSDKGSFNIIFKQQADNWIFNISNHQDENESFSIKIIRSNNESLFLNIKSVSLCFSKYDVQMLSTGWKAFERVLIKHHIKADLVQLNGYYQYKSNVVYSFIKTDLPIVNKSQWDVIESILEDDRIGEIISLSDLAISYSQNEEDLKTTLIELKNWGFEIRNHNTNPEIPHNHYLIPYKFPSLNRLSVQLKTSL